MELTEDLENQYKEDEKIKFEQQRKQEYDTFSDTMVDIAVKTPEFYGIELEDNEKNDAQENNSQNNENDQSESKSDSKENETQSILDTGFDLSDQQLNEQLEDLEDSEESSENITKKSSKSFKIFTVKSVSCESKSIFAFAIFLF